MVANPTDVVKVRLQAELRSAVNTPPRYKNTFHAYRTIVKEDGFVGLYRGIIPNILRNSLMNMTELATYDLVKETLTRTFQFKDGPLVHVGSGSFPQAALYCSPGPFV
jgi:solute carrier family 25 (mitochondrial uncoupling protein), member 8/9